jgi:spermidine dehydrogenase
MFLKHALGRERTSKGPHDSALEVDQQITRRDFMNATLLASGGAALTGLTPYQIMAQMGKDNWTGYGGVSDYAASNGNTYEVMSSGHQIRDHFFAKPPQDAVDTGEVLDFVILGRRGSAFVSVGH